ncbi:MAG: hypothetical protein ACLP19_05255 [Xanthobacteraceae bacterium]
MTDESITYGHQLTVHDATAIGPAAGENLLGLIAMMSDGRVELVGAVVECDPPTIRVWNEDVLRDIRSGYFIELGGFDGRQGIASIKFYPRH